MPKSGETAARGLNGRLRHFTYQPRKQYPLRLPGDVYDRLVAASESALMPNTMYVSTVLELWLAGQRVVQGLALPVNGDSSDRITVTVRLPPSLFVRLSACAKTHSVSVNRLITFVLDVSLREPSSN